MKINRYQFGLIEIDGHIYEQDIIIDNGEIKPRRKELSDPCKGNLWHTPLSEHEIIPWDCQTLYIGTGESAEMGVLEDVHKEADVRGVKLIINTTPKIVEKIKNGLPPASNALLHLTC